MSLCSSLCQGRWWTDIKMMTPIDAKLVPVEVQLMEGKTDLKPMLVTEIAVTDTELSPKFFNFTFPHHLEKLRLVLKIQSLGKH